MPSSLTSGIEEVVRNDSEHKGPDVCRETRAAIVDMIRGQKPTTVLGLLLWRNEPLTKESIAGLLGKSVQEVAWTVEMLELEDLCAQVTENGVKKVKAFAAYSERNGIEPTPV
jgi:hypothetical protein